MPSAPASVGTALAFVAVAVVAGCAHDTPVRAPATTTLPPPSMAAPTTCSYRTVAGHGPLPDPRCTPGATNPAVRSDTTVSTICIAGWTTTVRPSASVTEPEKYASMAAYGDGGSAADYEFDHLIPLELGGATNDRANLWPQPHRGPWSAAEKDRLESTLRALVCDGRLALATAQQAIASDWIAAYGRYVQAP